MASMVLTVQQPLPHNNVPSRELSKARSDRPREGVPVADDVKKPARVLVKNRNTQVLQKVMNALS